MTRLLETLTGRPADVPLERRILLLALFLTALTTVLSVAMAVVLGQPAELLASGALLSLLSAGAYLIARRRQAYALARAIFAVVVVLVIPLGWFFNEGSRGPVLTMFIFGAMVLTIVSPLRWRLYTAIFMGAGLAALLAVDYLRPQWLVAYDSEAARMTDIIVLIGGVVYPGSIALILYIIGNYRRARDEAQEERNRSDQLLNSIMPPKVAQQLRASGRYAPEQHDDVSIIFADFEGFTQIAEKMSPSELVAELEQVFLAFDEIAERCGVQRIKTIGDAYMAAAGVPDYTPDHAVRALRCALMMQEWIAARNASAPFAWRMRCGVHSGPVVAGVLGKRRFAYDIWGDAVNVASRVEAAGKAGLVNASGETRLRAGDHFRFEARGSVEIKNRSPVQMYFVQPTQGLLSR